MRRWSVIALVLLAGCTSPAEWRARADIALAESATQAALARAREAEAFARSQTDIATTAMWAGIAPFVGLLIGVLVVLCVVLWFWDRHARRQRAAEQERTQLQLWWLQQQAFGLALPGPTAPPAVQIEAQRRGLLPAPQGDAWLLLDTAGRPRMRMLPAPMEE